MKPAEQRRLKACRNCRYFAEPGYPFSMWFVPRCEHPSGWGFHVIDGATYSSCLQMRKDDSACGPHARLFVQRPRSWLERLLAALSLKTGGKD